MRILVLLLITLLGCGACKEQHDHKGKTPLVEVDGNFLYKEDLMSVLPVGLSKDDRRVGIWQPVEWEDSLL